MSVITVICATHRNESNTMQVANIYLDKLRAHGLEAQLLTMAELPTDFIISDSFGNRSPEFESIMQKYLVDVERFVLVVPEYNGSIPGVFKAFIDACDVKLCFAGKKAALVGVASGRAGNLRGLDHLTDILHHLRVEVLSNKLPISKVHDEIDEDGKLINSVTEKVVNKQLEEFMKFCC